MGVRNTSTVRILRRAASNTAPRSSGAPAMEARYALFADAGSYGMRRAAGSYKDWPPLALVPKDRDAILAGLRQIRRRAWVSNSKFDSWRVGDGDPLPAGISSCYMNWIDGEDRLQLVVYLENPGKTETEVCLNQLPSGELAVRISQDRITEEKAGLFAGFLRSIVQNPNRLDLRPT